MARGAKTHVRHTRTASVTSVPELPEVAVGQGCPLWLDMFGPHCPVLGIITLRSSYPACQVLWSRALVTGRWAGSPGCRADSMTRYLINGYFHIQHQIRKQSTVFDELPGGLTMLHETMKALWHWNAFCITALCELNSPLTGGFLSLRMMWNCNILLLEWTNYGTPHQHCTAVPGYFNTNNYF